MKVKICIRTKNLDKPKSLNKVMKRSLRPNPRQNPRMNKNKIIQKKSPKQQNSRKRKKKDIKLRKKKPLENINHKVNSFHQSKEEDSTHRHRKKTKLDRTG